MTDFDFDLIGEYKRFPVFYDRNCEGFKNKVVIEQAWKIIGRKLCYNPDLLKTRMIQLRSRYTMEKRKLQAMRKEGTPNPEPSWGLFHNLNFLSGHIKHRRPYRKFKSIHQRYKEAFHGFTIMDLKSARNLSRKVQQHNSLSHLDRQSHILNNIHTLKQSLLQDGQGHPSDKLKAFGSFVTMSLQDLPREKALVMIAEFTKDIVRALLGHPAPESSNSTMYDSIQPSTSHKLQAELIDLKNAHSALKDVSQKKAVVIIEKLSIDTVRALPEPTPESSNCTEYATIQPSTSFKVKTELIELENASSAWF